MLISWLFAYCLQVHADELQEFVTRHNEMVEQMIEQENCIDLLTPEEDADDGAR